MRWCVTINEFIVAYLIQSNTGLLGGSVVERLPSAQGVILETRDQVPHWVPWMEAALLSASVSASLSVSHEWMNEWINKWINE